jgi:hypothetical protein
MGVVTVDINTYRLFKIAEMTKCSLFGFSVEANKLSQSKVTVLRIGLI